MTDNTTEIEFADFDAFAEEQGEPERTGVPFRLYGRTWRLPEQVGGMFALLVQRMHASEDAADVQRLVAYLFGRHALDEFLSHGMGDDQFATLLIWATDNIREPGSMTIAEADAERRRREDAKGKGQGPNRAQRRSKKTKQRSSGAQS